MTNSNNVRFLTTSHRNHWSRQHQNKVSPSNLKECHQVTQCFQPRLVYDKYCHFR